MQDGERHHDGAGPGRHLVQEIEGQQHHFGRDAGAILARVEVEEAEVDLDVAVGRLDAAQFQDAGAQARHAGVVDGDARQFQGEVGLDGGADFRRSAGVDVQTAVGKLTIENCARGLLDERTRLGFPDAVLGRIQPELEQDVIGFEGGVGAQFGAPVAVALLQTGQPAGGAAHGMFGRGFQRVTDLYRSAH